MNDTQLLILFIAVVAIVILAHQEYRYRCLVNWIDAVGQMLSDWKDDHE